MNNIYKILTFEDKKNTYWEVWCDECDSHYEFLGTSILPQSMTCKCGEEIIVPACIVGYNIKDLKEGYK